MLAEIGAFAITSVCRLVFRVGKRIARLPRIVFGSGETAVTGLKTKGPLYVGIRSHPTSRPAFLEGPQQEGTGNTAIHDRVHQFHLQPHMRALLLLEEF